MRRRPRYGECAKAASVSDLDAIGFDPGGQIFEQRIGHAHAPFFAQAYRALETIALVDDVDRHAGNAVFRFGAERIEQLPQLARVGLAVELAAPRLGQVLARAPETV